MNHRRTSQRTMKKKLNESAAWGTNKNSPKNLSMQQTEEDVNKECCNYCNILFRNKIILAQHMKTCPEALTAVAVEKAKQNKQFPRKSYDTTGKYLPLSQPLNNEQQQHTSPKTYTTITASRTPIKPPVNSFNNNNKLPQSTPKTGNNAHPNRRQSYMQKTVNDQPIYCVCSKIITKRQQRVKCDHCNIVYHRKCTNVTANEYKDVKDRKKMWKCETCRRRDNNYPVQDNPPENQNERNLKWGDMEGKEMIEQCSEQTYEKIMKWKRNIFTPPKSNVGKQFIAEATRLLELFNKKTAWEGLAMRLFHIFIPIMLQKPSAKSKNQDHMRYLTKRLEMWKNGQLKELMSECEEIQSRLQRQLDQRQESTLKGFTRLMLMGKVAQALKLVNEQNNIAGVHKLDENVVTILESKHPDGEELNEEALLPQANVRVEEVTFEEIDGSKVLKAIEDMTGSGGPTLVDVDIWKVMACSKSFGNASSSLCDEVAVLARRLCMENIPHENISAYLACRLVPLSKRDGGVRPVGIGETLRRIVGKTITRVLKKDIQQSCGTLQTCTGIQSGIEGAIHAVKDTFDEDETEAVMLVDADNAFNRLNRKVALHNIKSLCPKLHQYIQNSYNSPVKLYLGDGSHILSKEGTTQGDNTAMAMYALGTKPLIDTVQEDTINEKLMQAWFAAHS